MRAILYLVCLCASLDLSAQEEFNAENFEHQVLYYEPEQRVSDKDYAYAKMILSETKKATENNPSNFNVADYFNVLSAFLTLHENESTIKLAFKKFINSEGSCEYILEFEVTIRENPKYDIVREDYLIELEKCKANPKLHEAFDPEAYSLEGGYDLGLVKSIYLIHLSDQKYRKGSGELDPRQSQLDIDNQKLIDKIYEHRGTYIGRNLVGEKFENVMWSVIQHSNLEMMERYIPVIQEAVEINELDETPFKMLLDRYYAAKYGYQFFGSQLGIDIADDEMRIKVLKEYNLE